MHEIEYTADGVKHEMMERLEKCCDGCEKVADTVELIILKNS